METPESPSKRLRPSRESALWEPGVSVVRFSEDFMENSYHLFELPQDIEQDILNGVSCHIKGSSGTNTDAVLCTMSKTYAIKRVETSNHVFVVPSSSAGSSLISSSMIGQFYELHRCEPSLDRIADLLAGTCYDGANDDLARFPKLTISDVEGIVLASRTEIENYLKSHNVVEINGFLRLLSTSAIEQTTRAVLDTMIEQSSSLKDINFQVFAELMAPVDEIILNAAFSTLGVFNEKTKFWDFNFENVAIASAHSVFSELNSSVAEKGEFTRLWALRTPGKVPPSETLLRGVAVVESSTHFRYLPASRLSIEISQRLKDLFKEKEKFSAVELEPYVRSYFGGSTQPKTLQELMKVHNYRLNNEFYQQM